MLDISLFDMASLVVHFCRGVGRRITRRKRPHSSQLTQHSQQVHGPAQIEFRDPQGELILSVTILHDDARNA